MYNLFIHAEQSRFFYLDDFVAPTRHHRLTTVPAYQPRCYDTRSDRYAVIPLMTPDEILNAFDSIRVW